MNNEYINKYCEMNNIQYIFLDFFGTIVTRDCQPNEIKYNWAKELSIECFREIEDKLLYNVRIQAEQAVIKRAKNGEFNYRELTDEIYRRLEIIIGSNFNERFLNYDTFYEISYQIECKCEMGSQRIIEETRELIEIFYSKGKKIFIISDFYLDSTTIKKFINKVELDKKIERIFVSCDERCSKSTGKLYEIVLNKLNISSKDCIMIGDNKISDIKNAKKNGIQSFKINSLDGNQYTKVQKMLENISQKNKKGVFAYSNYCFLLYLYIERLVKELIKDKVSDVYFLAREGEFLKRLFDEYVITYKNVNIKSHYLYVSRKATYPATLKKLEEEDFEILRTTSNDLSMKSFFKNIGINDFSELIIENINIEKKIKNFFISKEFEIIKNNVNFRNLYEKSRKESKKLIREYFKNQGMERTKEIALVDVGWNGTMQDNIQKIMNGKICKGYYIGVLDKAFSSKDNLKKGIIFTDNPLSSKDKEIWEYDHVFLERILWASHGSTNFYKKINEEVVPQLENYDNEKESYLKIKPIQNLILEKFLEIDKYIKNSPFFIETFYKEILYKHIDVLFNINSEQLKLQRDLFNGQIQNFGNITTARESFNSVFNKQNIIKKGIKKIKLIKNTELMFRILLNYQFYKLIRILYYFKGKSLKNKKGNIL